MAGTNRPPPSTAPTTPVLPRMKSSINVSGISPQASPQPPLRPSTPSLLGHSTIGSHSPRTSARKPRSETILPVNLPSPTPGRPLAGPTSGSRSSSLTSKVALKKLAPNPHDAPRPRPTSSMGPPPERAATPMFFHASDVKGPEKGQQPKFFFADQSTLDNEHPPTPRLKAAPPSPRLTHRASVLLPSSKITITPPATRPASIVGPPTPRANPPPPKAHPLTPATAPDHRSHVKFVYANGTEEFLEPRKPGGESESSDGSHHYPSSPHSSTQSSGISTTKIGPLTPLSSPGAIASIPQLFAQRPSPQQIDAIRRSSFESARARHGRAMSLGSTPDFKLQAGLSGLASPDEEAEAELETAVVETPIPISPPPLSGAQQKIKEMEARAAEARRERKVMDLEISNTSLMAINKSLEKQMRKQASQLRRYKRLARAGALTATDKPGRSSSSLSPTRPGSPSLSETSSSVTSSSLALGDSDSDSCSGGGGGVRKLPSTNSSIPPSLADSDSDSGDTTETETGGLGLHSESETDSDSDDDDDSDGGNIEKHREGDERRLNADLAKHKALLEASAKMNASLRRCELVVDQMIRDAKRALQYCVQPEEVRLGGRVVYRDDDEEEEEDGGDGDGDDEEEQDSESRSGYDDPVDAPGGKYTLPGNTFTAPHRGPVATGLRMAIPLSNNNEDTDTDTDTDLDDAASAFGEFYDGDKYDNESEWDAESDLGSELGSEGGSELGSELGGSGVRRKGLGIELDLPDVGSVGSGPRYRLV
ncbi:hypothetical protein EX30DRAFT_375490 [Ascodesmis nigricans]|uniref:Uncharacterized protein n=1 Tax=Ascodesmis nigricans TaxID=341454 RepID=A0A4S2MQ00_9PEZI|nr:hypothetical protein EX30DRAFT_375490 [Ascodesmis nigricans]